MTITERLADYAMSIHMDTISPDVRAIAEQSVTEIVGCMLAGSQERSVRMMEELYSDICAPGEYRVIGASEYGTDLLHAVMLNAMEAHVRDFDDIVVGLSGHSTISVFPVALVVGEYVGASGNEVLEAYITGVEIAGTLGRALFAEGYKAGWDSSGTIGIFGAAAAAARLLRLTRKQFVHALGIAVNEASGTRSVYGYMNKDISAGHTAMKGVFCALAAQKGFDSCPESFENISGYLATFAEKLDEELLERIIGERISVFQEPGIIRKLYPSCRDTHCAVDAAMELAKEYAVNIEEISHGVCYAQESALYNDRFPYPDSPSQAKFSMPYGVALALAAQKLTLDDFDGQELKDPTISALCRKLDVVADDQRFSPDAAGGAEVVICMKDGTQYSKKVEVAAGDPAKPLEEHLLKEKFMECVRYVSDTDRAEELYDKLTDISQISNMKGFIEYVNSIL